MTRTHIGSQWVPVTSNCDGFYIPSVTNFQFCDGFMSIYNGRYKFCCFFLSCLQVIDILVITKENMVISLQILAACLALLLISAYCFFI